MRFWARTAVVASLISCTTLAQSQARTLINTPTQQVNLPGTPGHEVVLGSVALGKPRTFSMFDIQAAGYITPDPDLNGATFQLRFWICDQPDCSGDIRSTTRILPDADSVSPAQVIATRSFGVSTHNAEPVVLTDLKPRTSAGILYLAVSLKLVRGSGTTPFVGKLNLLRVDVMP